MAKQYARRKIKFYRAHIGEDDGGEPLMLDARGALKTVEHLAFCEGDSGRYHRDIDGNVLCGFPKQDVGGSPALQFCLIRRQDLPRLERAGAVSDLDIDEASGLMEVSHVLFFPDNIVGVEYNHFGARPWRLADYFVAKAGDAFAEMRLDRLLRQDIGTKLDNLKDVRLIELRVKPSYSSTIRRIDESLADALDANAKVFAAPDTVDVVLRPSQAGQRGALAQIKSTLSRLAQRDDLEDNAERAIVKGKDGESDRVRQLDILGDQLAVEKRIERIPGRSRGLDSTAAFQAILEAYEEVRDDIESSFLVWS